VRPRGHAQKKNGKLGRDAPRRHVEPVGRERGPLAGNEEAPARVPVRRGVAGNGGSPSTIEAPAPARPASAALLAGHRRRARSSRPAAREAVIRWRIASTDDFLLVRWLGVHPQSWCATVRPRATGRTTNGTPRGARRTSRARLGCGWDDGVAGRAEAGFRQQPSEAWGRPLDWRWARSPMRNTTRSEGPVIQAQEHLVSSGFVRSVRKNVTAQRCRATVESRSSRGAVEPARRSGWAAMARRRDFFSRRSLRPAGRKQGQAHARGPPRGTGAHGHGEACSDVLRPPRGRRPLVAGFRAQVGAATLPKAPTAGGKQGHERAAAWDAPAFTACKG